jgi:mono/diheme cytochrome c family protein
MKKGLAIGIGALVAVGVAVGVALFLKDGDDPKPQDPGVIVELRPKPGDPNSIVDPMNGRMLFEHNCVTCHGWRGEGNGPADPYLWRRPRNLGDASYMNSRTDDQISLVLAAGGRVEALSLSRIMPAWNITFNTYQQADVAAWVRRLHITMEDLGVAGDAVRYEAVLTPARLAEVKAKSGTEAPPEDATVVVYAAWGDRKGRAKRENAAVPPVGTAGLAGHAGFVRVTLAEGRTISAGMLIGPDRKVKRALVHEKVTLKAGDSVDSGAVDAFVKAFEGAGDAIKDVNPPAPAGRAEMFARLGGALKRLYWRLLLAIDQDKEDWDEIAAGKKPGEAHPGRAIYDRLDCGKCHGPTGKAKGPGVAEREPLPANFADGVRMGQLSDEYILLLLENGGPAMNISGVMPSYGSQATKEELQSVTGYLRTLAPSK